jgi:hypothetical protein
MKQALDFIKANMIALSCAIVALVAMVAIFFWPIPGIVATLQGEVAARKQTYDEINGLLTGSRTLPNVDASITEAVPLTVFPTKNVIAAGTKAVQQVKDGSHSVLDAAVKGNARPLLVPNSLPKTSSFTRGEFLDKYRVETAQIGDNVDKGIVKKILHGTLPPTAEEQAAADQTRTNEIMRINLQTDARGVAQNQAQVDGLLAKMRADLPLQLRVGRAVNNQIYVSPGAVEIHPAMSDIKNLNDVTVFNAQFSLWIQMTLLEAIADANSNAKNVLDAPVKHLLMMRVPMNIADASAMQQPTGMGFGQPDAVAPAVALVPDAASPIAPKFDVDPLGYGSNSMYDSIRVQMVLRVDASRLSEVLAALSQKHLVKVRNVNFHTVSTGQALLEGFFYSRDGATPLAEVELDCDVLVLRAWLVPYMPEPVKTVFHQMANPTLPGQ